MTKDNKYIKYNSDDEHQPSQRKQGSLHEIKIIVSPVGMLPEM